MSSNTESQDATKYARAGGCGQRANVVFGSAQFIGTMLLFEWGWDASAGDLDHGPLGTAIMGKWMLGEPVNATRWFGIVLIMP
jgi:hypothetical protein